MCQESILKIILRCSLSDSLLESGFGTVFFSAQCFHTELSSMHIASYTKI